MSFEKNPYDGHTLSAAIRGAQKVGDTEVLYAGRISKEIPGSKRYRLEQKLHRRASIEPRIGHLKARSRLGRNYLKGRFGDMANVLLAASAMNLVSRMSWFFASILLMLLGTVQVLRITRSAFGLPTLKFQGTF
jgi:IS5 family transposase